MEKIVLGLDKIENTIKVSTDFIKSYYTHTHMYNKMLVYEPFDGYVTVNNVTEVCYRCGYGNLSHFLRSFKKKYGITPKAYQKLNTRDTRLLSSCSAVLYYYIEL